MSSPREEHAKRAPRLLRFALITVSSSRYSARLRGEDFSDESQEEAVKLIREGGHAVEVRDLVDDDVNMIRLRLMELLERGGVDVIVFIGGTGFSRRDVTVEAVKPLLEREVEGFGELFRYLSFREVGAAAFLSRAMMGTVGDKVVMCLPGSPNAIKVALKNFLPELPHLIYVLRSG